MERQDEMKEVMIFYFKTIFKSTRLNDVSNMLVGIERSINSDHNEMLTAEFRKEDIREAMWKFHLTKALRPDGLNVAFFQAHWQIVGNDVTRFFLDVFNGNANIEQVNEST